MSRKGKTANKNSAAVPGEQLYRQYQKLDPGPRMIVQLLAVNVQVCGVRKVMAAMAGVRMDGRVMDLPAPREMSAVTKALVQKKLIRKTNKGLQCDPELRPHVILELLENKHYRHRIQRMRKQDPVPSLHGFRRMRGYEQALRELQYLCYTGAAEEKIIACLRATGEDIINPETGGSIHEEVLPPHLAHAYSQHLSLRTLFFLLFQILEWDLQVMDPDAEPYYSLLGRIISENRDQPLNLHLILHLLLLRGDCELARQWLQDNTWADETYQVAGRAWISFLQGDDQEAVDGFAAALALFKKKNRKRKASLPGYFGYFHILSLIRQGGDGSIQEALEHIKRLERTKDVMAGQLKIWKALAGRQLGQTTGTEKIVDAIFMELMFGVHASPVPFLLSYYPLIWINSSFFEQEGATTFLDEIITSGQETGYRWLAALAAEILAAVYRDGTERARSAQIKKSLAGKVRRYEEISARLHGQCGTVSLAGLVRPVPEYEAALKSLINLAGQAGSKGRDDVGERLVWWISFDPDDREIRIEPRLQKLSKKGTWTKGRAVALKKLAREPDSYPCLTDQDRRVCAAIREETSGWGYRYHSYFELDADSAALALVGHPLLFLRGTTTPVQLVRGEPALRIKKSKKNITITLEPEPLSWKKTLIVQESATRYVVYSFSDAQRKMAELLQGGLLVPAKAEPMARKAADALAGTLTVQSEIGGGTEAREVEADSAPHVVLVPWDQGLRAEIVVRPLGQDGPAFPPGRGTDTVMAEIKGERLRTRRDLAGEGDQARALVRDCPVLSMYDRGDFQWELADPGDCLELLVQLRKQEQAAVEWPQGEKFSVRAVTGFDQLSLKMSKGAGDWFRASAKLAVDESLVLDLRQLLDRLGERQGRFIPLDDGSFLALTREFEKRLQDLSAYATPSGKGVRINPLATLALDDFFDQAGEVDGDKAWREHRRRFQPPEIPPVPSTLQAELRPYQVEGYRWLVTLAAWGVGACLADDMGLGKTVQALAALLTMAGKGPVLVVAPLSVVANWQDEALRFAPSFNVLRFGPGDRKAMLAGLGPFDLVVCSYGLLPKEAELLQAVNWQAVVLDEAQAIKNRNTKRSRAARGLRAAFRLITTGTPVENHLGELWTLFDFLNPGLLGSFKQFSEKFGNIGAEAGDPESRERLRALIRPFILRRLKSEVLSELPPRTEITLRVAMSNEEKALYEAKRLQALEELESEEGGAGHLQILAHIMQLRRLCCNPALVLKKSEAAIPSSKLKVFGDIVRELIENRHKALVFSQFVGHLALIREFLDREKISYQYLDGQTSASQRKKRIAAFQAGEGDLFLISLKAGGAGLNLTAADYVIHMDPWWNPAVEDQASDRAHRIGQKRPVTVYRLVMEGTIEEQIVELHAKKRDLANSLLEGTDVSGRMSAEELLALLREQG